MSRVSGVEMAHALASFWGHELTSESTYDYLVTRGQTRGKSG